MMPALIMVLLVTGLAVLLVLDKLWIDMTQQELRMAAEVSALAAAGELVDDSLLTLEDHSLKRSERARRAAEEVAARNRASGFSVVLNAAPGGDVQIGRHEYEILTDQYEFVETDDAPTTVIVSARRSRGMIPLGYNAMAHQPVGHDLVETATAAVSNVITGVRPSRLANVPAWPLAILEHDPSGLRRDTWRDQIELRQGSDYYGYDANLKQVVMQPDGLPEIMVHAAPLNPEPEQTLQANLHIIDIGNGLYPDAVADQIRNGWSIEDLADFGGVLSFHAGPLEMDSDAVMSGLPAESLRELIGTSRICTLYSNHVPTREGLGRVLVERLVAVRIMDVQETSQGGLVMVLQPAVVATRTAEAAPAIPLGTSQEDPLLSDGYTNPYIYRIFLTR